jgi:predicted alpha/beta-fold hydrolase
VSHDFRPLPLLGNAHLQTVLGTVWKGRPFLLPSAQRLVELPDGDRLQYFDTVSPDWRPGRPVAVLIHGLGGSHHSGFAQRVAGLLAPYGVRIVRPDLRGNCESIPLARSFYTAGSSDDVRAVVEAVAELCPGSPVDVVGLSLSGNIVLKLAAEAAVRPLPALRRVVSLAPPIDLARSAAMMGHPRNRFYDRHFSRELLAEARLRFAHHGDPPLPDFPKRLSIRVYDDLYTAPRHGYADALDYYRRAAAEPLVPEIRVPTLILTARDDPFIAVEPIEALRGRLAHVEVRVLDRGGHMGFLGWDGAGGIRWAERQVANWLLSA